MSDNTRLEVQAILLNSEALPLGEVESALESVAEFAHGELDMEEEAFLEFAKAAWKRGVERSEALTKEKSAI